MFKNAVFFLLIIAALFACQADETLSDSKYLAAYCQSADSIIERVSKNPKDYAPSVLSNALIRFYFKGDKAEAKKLLSKWKESESLKNAPEYPCFLISDLGYFYLWENQLDSCYYYIQLREKLKTQDSLNQLSFLNLKGSYFYQNANFKQSKLEFFKGFTLARKFKVNQYIEQFSVNLGAIAFEQNQFGSASYYFSNAYAILKADNRQNSVLINNLAASLLNEDKSIEAKAFLDQLPEELKIENDQYQGILTKLNYIDVSNNLGNLKTAGHYLTSMVYSSIPPSLQGHFLSSYLKFIEANEWVELPVFLRDFESEVKRHPITILNKFGSGMAKLIEKDPHYFNVFGLDTLESIESFPLYSQYIYYKLKGIYLLESENVMASLDASQKALSTWEMYNAVNDSIKLADTKNSIALVELEERLKISNRELEFSKEKEKQSKIIISLLIITTLIILVLGYFVYTNRTQRIQYAELQLNHKTKEAEYLSEESQLNSRITSLSNIIIKKSRELANTIKSGPYSKEPEIYLVQKELERMSMIEFAVNSEPAKSFLEQNPDFLNLAVFSDLNETHRRVLILSVENYKPKEIATTLNLSYAYVRNVQSKLRKTMSELHIEQFPELKNFQGLISPRYNHTE